MEKTIFNQNLLWLSSEGASFGQSSLTTSWLAQDSGAASAENDGLSMGENGGDCVASWALDIHEVGVWLWYQSLQLVLSCFVLSRWIE